MILNDKQITKLASDEEMISPFVNKSISKGISHGLNSFGYDLRCGSEFKIFTNIKGATADPKNFSEDNFITVNGEESILIQPNSFALDIATPAGLSLKENVGFTESFFMYKLFNPNSFPNLSAFTRGVIPASILTTFDLSTIGNSSK